MNKNNKTDRIDLLSILITEAKAKYSEYLKELSEEFPNLKNLISKIKNPDLNLSEWKNTVIKIDDIGILKRLANPYFIGYGNPNSEILIMGKEKAFDVSSNPDLLFLESIKNISQWEKIISNKIKWENSVDLDFDPRFPKEYHEKIKDRRHTWYKYSVFLSSFIEDKKLPQALFEESKDKLNSLFNYCFCTELNSTPSKRTQNITTSKRREEYLKIEFYKGFKYVLIAGVSTLGKLKSQQDDKIEEIFDAKFIEPLEIGFYGQGKTRKVNLYKSEKQIIVTCAQLSGTTGWKNEHIPILGEKVRELNLNE